MSKSNGSEAADLIRDALEPLVAARDTITDEITELEAAVGGKKDELKRIERLLRDGGLLEPPKKSSKRAKRTSWVSEDMLNHARAVIPDGPFTIRDLTSRMEVSEASVRNTVDALRDLRELRLLGNRVRAEDNRAVAHYEAVA